MSIVHTVGRTLQTLFGTKLDAIGIETGAIQRKRKFTGSTLISTLVLTLLRNPNAKPNNYVATAAQLGVIVTPEAIEKRFTPRLVRFVRAIVEHACEQVVASQPVDSALLQKFTSVRIGDSTSLTLPDEYADEFPGCGGKSDSGKAVMKIQVEWELITGQVIEMVLEPGRRSDAKSALMEGPVPAGSLSIHDLGYFSLKRFRELGECGAFWISRWQPGTLASHPDGRPLDLLEYARRHSGGGVIDIPIRLGAKAGLACRLILLRAPQQVANERRRKAYERAQKHGRTLSQEHLAWCDWTVFVTNCPVDLLTWQEVVVLYRVRWQIELMFKLWKSHSQLDKHKAGKSADWQMAELLAKLVGVIVQHWLLLTSTWLNPRRSLWKAAGVIRDWIVPIIEALDDLGRLVRVLERMGIAIGVVVDVETRGKHPSSFQLLSNPELLEWEA
jgi:hypothetical protein